MASVLKWQLYKHLKADVQSGLKNVPEHILFPQGHEEDLPECFLTYLRLKGGQHWWPGGVADQPHLLVMEVEACAAGVAKYENEAVSYLRKIDAQGRKES